MPSSIENIARANKRAERYSARYPSASSRRQSLAEKNDDTAMPIFMVRIKEEVKRTITAYVEASDKRAADKWASNAPIFLFRQEREESEWAEVAEIAEVDVVPDGYRSRKA